MVADPADVFAVRHAGGALPGQSSSVSGDIVDARVRWSSMRDVIPILVGVALLALGVRRFQRQRVPSAAVRLPGTITDVQETRSMKNRRLTLRRPVVTVEHPLTGRREQFEPDEYDRQRYRVGDVVDVAYLRSGDRFVLVPDRPVRDRFLIPVVGLAVIGLQVADWLS